MLILIGELHHCQLDTLVRFTYIWGVPKRYGSRTVIKEEVQERHGCRRLYWLMQCDCGNKSWAVPKDVLDSTSCRQCKDKRSRSPIPLGKRYGSRIVISTNMRGHNQYCLMKCDCGAKDWAKGSGLLRTSACRECGARNMGIKRRVKIPHNFRIGFRTIIKTEMRRKHSLSYQYWLMRCPCGAENWAKASSILNVKNTCCLQCKGLKRRLPSLVGKRYGSRTVIDTKITNGKQLWLLLCDCGTKLWAYPGHVLRGKQHTCSKCASIKNGKNRRLRAVVGQRFGSRTIIEVSMRNKQTMLRLRCDCGKQSWRSASEVITRKRHCATCQSCAGKMSAEKQFHPNLTKKELQTLLNLHVYKKQSLKQLQEAR